jgi:hypothetical protein
MKLFGISEAKYYCSSFGATRGDSQGSIDSFLRNRMGTASKTIKEGTQTFAEYRDCSLRDVERCLFFAASHFRRCLDLMIASASPWAHVTIYYGNWYASRALLGIFGCTIFGSVVIDVEKSTPGQQVLRLRRIGNSQGQQPTTYRGSHRKYWDLFYKAVKPLRPMVQVHLAPALSPVKGDPVWLIQQRNDINYDSCSALDLAYNFQESFSKNRFPACLPGALYTQFAILESLLELSYSYISLFKLRTDALANIGRHKSLRKSVSKLVYSEKCNGLVRKTKKSLVT